MTDYDVLIQMHTLTVNHMINYLNYVMIIEFYCCYSVYSASLYL